MELVMNNKLVLYSGNTDTDFTATLSKIILDQLQPQTFTEVITIFKKVNKCVKYT